MFVNVRLYIEWRLIQHESEFTALYFNLDDIRMNNDAVLRNMAMVQIRSLYSLNEHHQFTVFRFVQKHMLNGPYSLQVQSGQSYSFPVGIQDVAISKFVGAQPADIDMNIRFLNSGFEGIFNPSDHTTALQNGRVLELFPPIFFQNAHNITIQIEDQIDPVRCSLIYHNAVPLNLRREH